MNRQMEQVNITENLANAYSYAFIETAPYSFIIPTKAQYVAVNLRRKICHCLSCGASVQVDYKQEGVVYFSRARFEKQRKLYEKRGLVFPDRDALEAQAPFIYREEGYCSACAERALTGKDVGQTIYNLCRALHLRDRKALDEARAAMGERIKTWLGGIASSAQLSGYDLSSYSSLENLLCMVVLDDLRGVEECLAAYREDARNQIGRIEELLRQADDRWEAYAARPTTIYESMSDELYHEYTVAFPVKETVDQEFYALRKIEKSRVRLFLEQARLQTVEELLAEAGFLPVWVDWLIDRVTALRL